MALQAIANRKTSQGLAPRSDASNGRMSQMKKPQSTPLFDLDEDDEDEGVYTLSHAEDPDSENEALSIAIQASLDDAHPNVEEATSRATASSSKETYPVLGAIDNVFVSPSRLETVLSFANISPSSSKMSRRTALFGEPSLLSKSTSDDTSGAVEPDNDLEDAYINVEPSRAMVQPESFTDAVETAVHSETEQSIDEPVTQEPIDPVDAVADGDLQMPISVYSDSDEDMEEVIPELTTPPQVLNIILGDVDSLEIQQAVTSVPQEPIRHDLPPSSEITAALQVLDETREDVDLRLKVQDLVSPLSQQVPSGSQALPPTEEDAPLEERGDDDPIHWSRSPSPTGEVNGEASSQVIGQSWDAAEEMDPHAEESEFARFMSQVKGRNLEDVRREIDDEIETLNQQRKAAMRNAEDITQQMVAQIMVSPSS
jgi:DNA excision repair protein ERCC-5